MKYIFNTRQLEPQITSGHKALTQCLSYVKTLCTPPTVFQDFPGIFFLCCVGLKCTLTFGARRESPACLLFLVCSSFFEFLLYIILPACKKIAREFSGWKNFCRNRNGAKKKEKKSRAADKHSWEGWMEYWARNKSIGVARQKGLTIGHEQVEVETILVVLIAAHLLHHRIHIHDFVQQLVQHHRVLLLRCLRVLIAVRLRHRTVSDAIPRRQVVYHWRAKAQHARRRMSVRNAEIGDDPLRSIHFHKHAHDRALLFNLHCRRIATHHLQYQNAVTPTDLLENHF